MRTINHEVVGRARFARSWLRCGTEKKVAAESVREFRYTIRLKGAVPKW
jgi:hypothetical protein